MNAPFVLLLYQQRWIADRSQVKLMEKSRRVGISWAEASDAALEASAKNGEDTWYITYNKDSAEEFIRDIAFWAKHYQLAASEMEETVLKDEDKDILTFVVRFASGFKVSALASAPRNLRGKQGRIILDEAAFHSDLKGMIKAAIALLMWGGRVHIISTHFGVNNEFNLLIKAIKEGRLPYSHHRVTLDDAIADGLVKRIFLVKGLKWSPEAEKRWRDELLAQYADDAEEELFCIPKQGGGVYFSQNLLIQCSVATPVIRLPCPEWYVRRPETAKSEVQDWCEESLLPHLEALPNLPHAFGQDFGRKQDVTVIAPVTIRKQTRTVPFLVELGLAPFAIQKEILFFILDRLPRFQGGHMDATGNGAYLGEAAAQKYGHHRIKEVMITQGWYLQTMPSFKADLEDGMMTIPDDKLIQEDMRHIQEIDGIPKVVGTKSKTGRHGDAAVALAMAWAASQEAFPTYAYEAANNRQNRESFWEKRGDTQPRELFF